MCHRFLLPFLALAGNVPARNAKDVPVTVHFKSDKHSAAFHFDREFRFPEGKPFYFRFHITHVKDNEIIERMGKGICWRAAYVADGRRVRLIHKGYALQIGKIRLPLPIGWLIGKGDAEEYAIDEHCFDMRASLLHPLFGKIYEYKGSFKVAKEAW